MRDDIESNRKEMNGGIKVKEFREIMDVYWSKLGEFS